jgi:hypothetical protein
MEATVIQKKMRTPLGLLAQLLFVMLTIGSLGYWVGCTLWPTEHAEWIVGCLRIGIWFSLYRLATAILHFLADKTNGNT